MIMKVFKVVLLSLFFVFYSYAQNSVTVDLVWRDNGVYDSGTSVYVIPKLNSGNLLFDNENRSILYSESFLVSNWLDDGSIKFSQVKFEILTDKDLGDLSRNNLPKSFEFKLTSTKDRDLYKGIFTCNPIINDEGVLKRLKTVVLSYTEQQQNTILKRSSAVITSSILSSGDWYRFYIQKSGVYKLTKKFLTDLGLNTSQVNPNNLKIYGTGGAMAPLLNSISYPLDPKQLPLRFVGNSDSVFADDEYFVFYGEGVDTWSSESFTHVNLYADQAYYYVTVNESDSARLADIVLTDGIEDEMLDTYVDYKFHEQDLVNPAKLGRKWFGENFSNVNEKIFSFNFPNRIELEPISVTVRGIAISSVSTSMQVDVNNRFLGNVSFSSISSGSSILANEGVIERSTSLSGKDVSLKLTYLNSGVPTSESYLDYIIVQAPSFLSGYGKQFLFDSSLRKGLGTVVKYSITNASSISEVWDVTDIYDVRKVLNNKQNVFEFKQSLSGVRKYVAVDLNDLYVPLRGSNTRVVNQNLKGTVFLTNQNKLEDIECLIIASNPYQAQAEDLASFHKNTLGITSKVVYLDQIYTEFSGGKQDVAAIRNFVKYVYDNPINDQSRLKYVCLFGGASYDYKNRVTNNTNIVPVFHANRGFSLGSTFMSDDFYGLMDSNEGDMNSFKAIDVAVGRMLFKNQKEASDVVQKVKNYYSKEAIGKWRNDVVFISDDVDQDWEGIIQQDLDDLSTILVKEKPFLNVKKIHSDSYVQETSSGGERYPAVRKEINQSIENGTLVLDYFGHGGEDGLANERILEKSDVQSLSNNNKLPLIITVTCEFSRFDNPTRLSAGEISYLNPKGGAISLISTTRQIGVTNGLEINNALISNLFSYGSSSYVSISEALRLTKNDRANTGVNIVSYIGDPTLKLAIPKPKVELTHFNEIPIQQAKDTLQALGKAVFKGRVVDSQNVLLSDFNGELSVSLFDKNIKRKTLANDGTTKNGQIIYLDFETLGESVFKGSVSVTKGLFSIEFVVPKNIKIPVGKARFSFYGKNTETREDYTGVDLQVDIGGVNKNAPEDKTPPEVKLYLNNDSFVSGAIVNTNPMLIAYLKDENGINTSGGIGQDIVAFLDGNQSNPIVLNDYYETDLDKYQSGVVKYPLSNLEKGLHTLQLRAWDVYNNPIMTEIQFVVVGDENLVLDKVLNYPNPFVNYTEFWFNHNKPNEPLEVQLQIYTVSGKLVKTINQTVLNTGFLSRDVKWNGLDDFGDKIGKGVYIYKLSVKATISNQRAHKIEKLVVF